MAKDQISYSIGTPEKFRQAAVDLYDEAFGFKFSLAIKILTIDCYLMNLEF